MSLFTEWTELAQKEQSQEELKQFWTNYYEQEKDCYDKILSAKRTALSGTVAQLAEEFQMDPILFAGFLEGINTSLTEPNDDLDSLEADTALDVQIDYEKLYYNMLDAKADWLYHLPAWDGILTEEKRKEITKAYRIAGIVVNENKVGRNDPCPCGSGKKYKKCCGK